MNNSAFDSFDLATVGGEAAPLMSAASETAPTPFHILKQPLALSDTSCSNKQLPSSRMNTSLA